MNSRQSLPKARKHQLVTRKLGAEMLVYDRKNDEAHCLNATAAIVWAHCDGRTTVGEISRLLAEGERANDDVVWLALAQLRKSDLLQQSSVPSPKRMTQMSRRVMMQRLGIAAAVSVPVVTSIVAPAAASAASCLPTGTSCTTNAQCCSSNCADNGRGGFECT